MKGCNLFRLIAALAILAIPLMAQTAPNCQQLLAGHRYAFVFQGFVDLGPPIGLTPNAGGGFIGFNANGTFSAAVSASIGGIIVPIPLQGTYQMHFDMRTIPSTCVGTATADDGTTLQLVASNSGQLEQMHVDQGLVVVIDSSLMQAGGCSNATLHANYIYSANGFFAPPDFPQPFGSYTPLAFSGVISFDGKGNITGWDTVSLAGNIVPRTYTGTYNVKSDCTATSDNTDSLGNHFHTAMFVYQAAKAVAVVNTDMGTVLAFNVTRQ